MNHSIFTRIFSCNFQLVLISLLIVFLSQNSFAQNYEWASKAGGSSTDGGNATYVDASGNVYVIGFFRGTADFDPSASTYNLTSAGDADIFIQKLNSSGALVWAKKMGGGGIDSGYDITVDASGNVYTTGFFTGTADFDPGTGTTNFSSAGSYDIYVQKLNSSGNLVWARQMGGTGYDVGRGITVDSGGSVYVTGLFSNTADFVSGAGNYNVTSDGGFDIFALRLDSSGSLIWVYENSGSTSDDAGQDIAIKSGLVYITGYFRNTVCFAADGDIDCGQTNSCYCFTSAGERDAFVTELDASAGYHSWTRRMGGTGSDAGEDIAVDALDNIYTVGYFSNTVDFNPGSGTNNLTSAGSTDAFVQKMTSSGVYSWAKKIGGTGADQANSVAVAGDVYTTGNFSNTVDFNPASGSVFNLSSGGSTDIFIQKLYSSGSFAWAKKMGGTGADLGESIAVDASTRVYTTGNFGSTVDFNPNAGVNSLTASGGNDCFIQKLSAPTTCNLSIGTNFTVNATCNSGGSTTVSINTGLSPYLQNWSTGSNNATINNLAAGTYTVTVTDNAGCTQSSSVVISNLAPAVPTGVSATATSSSITIQWTAVPNAGTYGVRIREVGAANWTYINLLPANSTTITGLAACKNYQYGVKSNCSGGSPSSNHSTTTTISTTGCNMSGKGDENLNSTNNNLLQLYPNPAQNTLTVNYHTNEELPIQIVIFDLTGKIVLQQTANVILGDNTISIAVEQLPQGYYVVETNNGKTTLREKLLIIK